MIYDVYVVSFLIVELIIVCFSKQKSAYEMRISDWSSDVCSSDLPASPRSAPSRRSSARATPRSRGREWPSTHAVRNAGVDVDREVHQQAHHQPAENAEADENAQKLRHKAERRLADGGGGLHHAQQQARKSTRLNSSH